jgi:hypothetical protein
MKDGKGVITNADVQTEVYRSLAQESVPAIEEIARTKNLLFDQALFAYLNTDLGNSGGAKTQQIIRERIAALNSITKVLSDVPETGFGINKEGRVVPHDGWDGSVRLIFPR